MQSERP